jgi:hypothetical protein
MRRHRRHQREIPFSFDSFLDIVANVVGVIIRLILVVWVGARSYTWLQHQAGASGSAHESAAAKVVMDPIAAADPLQQEIAAHRLQLAEAQERLLAQLRLVQTSQLRETGLREKLAQLTARRQRLALEEEALGRRGQEQAREAQVVALNSDELRSRCQKVLAEIKLVEETPAPKKLLRYRTPISRPVQSEELFFECQHSRVAFIDIASLLKEVHDHLTEKEQLLRSTWEVHDVTSIMGAFRLRYSLERERGMLDFSMRNASPVGDRGFRYSLTGWEVEPVTPLRGETAEAAVLDASEFRQIVDGVDPQLTAVTFWVYPDSFSLFRRLRDFLYQRDVVVAGRPLPSGTPIMSTPQGTISRGQ